MAVSDAAFADVQSYPPILCAYLYSSLSRKASAGKLLGQMKKIHVPPLVFLGLALAFYLLAWVTTAGIFTFLGLIFELATWTSLFEGSRLDKKPE